MLKAGFASFPPHGGFVEDARIHVSKNHDELKARRMVLVAALGCSVKERE